MTDNVNMADLQAQIAELKEQLAANAVVRANDEKADKANDEQSEKDKEDEREGEKKAIKREKKDKEDEREGEERAMDAKSVQAIVDAAVAKTKAEHQALEQAKRDCRSDLGDMIAMDSAGDIYRAALKVRGVDVDAIPAGTEQIAYQAINVAARPAAPAVRANDSNSYAGGKSRFDTSRISVRLTN